MPALWTARHRRIVGRDHRPLRGGDPRGHSQAQGRHLQGREQLRCARRRGGHAHGRGHHRSRRGRGHGGFHRQLAADHDRHQRGAQLYARLFDLRGAQLPQPRSAQQHRLARPYQGAGARGLDPQLQLPGAGERAARGRHVRADADPQGAVPRDARTRDRRRVGRGLDHADPGPSRQRRALHVGDVQLFGRHGRARHQAGAERHLLSHRRRRRPGRDPGGRHADRLRPQGIAAGFGRQGPDAGRRRPDHPVPYADRASLAAERRAEPARPWARRHRWRPCGCARPLPRQWQVRQLSLIHI